MARYTKTTILNRGSFGIVSLVEDPDTHELYADKEVVPSNKRACAADQNILDARNEIDIYRRLGSHPNILKFREGFESDGCVHLVLEYCPGGDLHEAIKSNRIDAGGHERVRELVFQLIDVLEYCHSRGVYHRDIKPENLLLAADGSIRLADWGLATTERDCTEFGVGSEHYMAPECFDRRTKSYDAAKADIWAVGIVFVNMVFGHSPFKIATQRDRLFTDFAQTRESIFDIFPTMSQDVFAVLRHALTIDPDNRSLAGMRQALQELQTWTTDEEFDLAMSIPRGSFSRPSAQAPAPAPVPTTADRDPFGVPPAVAKSLSPLNSWDRLKQFTPRDPRFAIYCENCGSTESESEAETEYELLPKKLDDSVFSMDEISDAIKETKNPSRIPTFNARPVLIPRSWTDDEDEYDNGHWK